MFWGKGSLILRTRNYQPFTHQRSRWYPNGIKCIPEDIKLDPLSLAHWYWGDGATSNNGYRMVFHTDGFQKKDVYFLRDRLNALYGWTPTIQQRKYNQFILVINHLRHRKELVEYIQPFCPPCFAYKLLIKQKQPLHFYSP